jgi:A/G-specific adenine glycosylase
MIYMDKRAAKLLQWYEENKRDLPWRNTKEPYQIWLSEIILQQTRVSQGLDYYRRFVESYPDIHALAAAPERDVLKLWQGLGYYSRARNMLHTARDIVQRTDGLFPVKYEDIRRLKGIGNYTAAAIASFAYNQPYAVLDGNVMRVYSRLTGFTEPIDNPKGRKKLQHIADEFLVKENPSDYNQALMELGAMLCLPKNPRCAICPLQIYCSAYATHSVGVIPVKQAKKKKKKRFLNYLVIQSGDKIVLRKRTRGDIWQGLYDFPCIETTSSAKVTYLTETSQWQSIFGRKKHAIEAVSGEYRHILTHRTLLATFVKIQSGDKAMILPEGCEWVSLRKLHTFPVPRLIDRYLSANL